MVFFVYFQGDCANLEKFVPRRCRANPCGLTLTLLRKRPRYTSYESPWLHQKNIIHLVWYFFYAKTRDFPWFITVLLCNTNPCGLITNEERRKRVAFADIECNFIANKSDTKCPRKAQCNARFVERRRSEKWTSSLSSLLRKRASRFLRIPLISTNRYPSASVTFWLVWMGLFL